MQLYALPARRKVGAAVVGVVVWWQSHKLNTARPATDSDSNVLAHGARLKMHEEAEIDEPVKKSLLDTIADTRVAAPVNNKHQHKSLCNVMLGLLRRGVELGLRDLVLRVNRCRMEAPAVFRNEIEASLT